MKVLKVKKYFLCLIIGNKIIYFLGSGYRVRTTALLSHGVWSESCHVNVGLCLAPPYLFVSQLTSNIATHEGLQLCQPVQVGLSPKPIKRGI